MNGRVKIGLALGAGASRGLAHIGVLEVLEEYGVPVDFIAGCSIGSIIGCMSANGETGKTIHAKALEICDFKHINLFDITIPHAGLIRGQQIEKLICMVSDDLDIEQLKTPFVAVSACLEDGDVRIFDSGNTTDAVRASISVPGVFEPVILDGKTYVDGGVLVRVPVDAVRKMGADIVIAVDVGYVGGSRPSPKNIIDIMIYSFELQQWEVMRGRPTGADITIAPNTSGINPAMFNQVEECVEMGRAATLLVIDDVQKLIGEAMSKTVKHQGLKGLLHKMSFLNFRKNSTVPWKTRW